MNRPKNIGTAAETAVVRWCRDHGFTSAERLALSGALDQGDVRLTRGVHLEVKGGKAAEGASIEQIRAWMREADAEGRNAEAHCFLVRKRRGYGKTRVGQWHAHMRLKHVAPAYNGDYVGDTIIEMEFKSLLLLLRRNGWGIPIP